jgi:hypothetical protein
MLFGETKQNIMPWGLLSLWQKRVTEAYKIILGSRARPVCMANNLNAICEPIV